MLNIVSYSEGIDVLYSHNIFDLQDLDLFFWLSVTIPTQRFNVIRTLHICHQFPPLHLLADRSQQISILDWRGHQWEKNCHKLAAMEGLKRLRVNLGVAQNDVTLNLHQESALLEPLLVVKRPERFEVMVFWLQSEKGFEREREQFFQIIRPAPSISC